MKFYDLRDLGIQEHTTTVYEVEGKSFKSVPKAVEFLVKKRLPFGYSDEYYARLTKAVLAVSDVHLKDVLTVLKK